MTNTQTNIFITGATGYIGGSVLARLINRPDAASLNIVALVRSSEKAAKLKEIGVNVVVGSHSDSALVEKLASAREVDVSGTGVLANNFAVGEYATETIYDDNEPAQIETLDPAQPHRNVDLELVNADKQGYVKIYIIFPSTIYGIASGKLVDLGIQNPYSVQIPALIDASLDRGASGMVGKGKNIWPNVHIDDVADLYIILYDWIKTNPETGHGREGFYFGENGEHTLYDVGKAV
ncbi:hypothetical protein H0H81_006574 [Sphagnurus paluster]|uniref:NmrA-like domain-containing protein n=1 Tax=Sphagnurus paluster TaxID=117069 RepID=A0A9P7KLX7_9AGAR|nr:hypothetical protein H0H81_006574 [Sphagnurus paluster]